MREITHLRSKQEEVIWNFNFKRTKCQKKKKRMLKSIDCFLNDHYQPHYMLIIFIWKTKPLKRVQKGVIYIKVRGMARY